MEVRINQHRMLLLPEGAIYWINTQTLLIADAHLAVPLPKLRRKQEKGSLTYAVGERVG